MRTRSFLAAHAAPASRFRSEAGGLALATLLAFALRLLRLDFQPLWWDEGYSVWFATHPLGQMAALTAEDIHPPLYYALLHGWTALLGTAPAALRLLSVILGTLAIPALYLAGRRLFPGSRVPLLAAFLLAVNPLHVFYSQEVRMYGLVVLLSAGVLTAAWRLFDPPQPRAGPASWVPSLIYIALVTLALYTQYYAVFLPIALTLYALWRWRRDARLLGRWLLTQAAIGLLYLPWALYAAPKLASYVSQKVVADADRPLSFAVYWARHLAAFLAGHLEGPLAPWWPAALVLLAPAALGWALLARRPKGPVGRQSSESAAPSPLPMLGTVAGVTLVLGWLISLRAPFFPERGERLLILALPSFVLLLAAGVMAVWRRWRAAGYATAGGLVAISAASLAAFYAIPRYSDHDYRPLIAHTVEQGAAGDTVFCVYPWQVGYWRAYAPSADLTLVLSPDAAWGADVAAALDRALAAGRVWFPAHLASGAILETQIEAHLAGAAIPFANEWHGPGTRLSAWAATSAPGPIPFTPVRFAIPGGGFVTLAGVDALTGPAPAANAVTPLALHWQAAAPPPALTVSVRLTDDLAQIWAQHDYEPLGGQGAGAAWAAAAPGGQAAAADHLGLLIPAGTPPGRYRVELVVRPKDSARAADVETPEGRTLGQSARLYALDVTAADQWLGPERLPVAQRQQITLEDGIRFLGHSMGQGPIAPGDLHKINLFWQATAQPAADAIAFVQALGRDGAPIALWEAPPGAAYPTSAWRAGTLMRTQAVLRLPAVPDGRYQLIGGLFRADTKARLRTPSGADHIALGAVTVRGRPHRMAPPQPQQPASAVFGSTARLIGYDLAMTTPQPGAAFTLTLHWQALAATGQPYTVFVHLLDEAGRIRGYGDSEPGNGAFPTPGWLAGEYLADAHTVTVAADAEPGPYRLAVGLYDPASGLRLAVEDGSDHLLLDRLITVAAP